MGKDEERVGMDRGQRRWGQGEEGRETEMSWKRYSCHHSNPFSAMFAFNILLKYVVVCHCCENQTLYTYPVLLQMKEVW